jgi:hypothetical protein
LLRDPGGRPGPGREDFGVPVQEHTGTPDQGDHQSRNAPPVGRTMREAFAPTRANRSRSSRSTADSGMPRETSRGSSRAGRVFIAGFVGGLGYGARRRALEPAGASAGMSVLMIKGELRRLRVCTCSPCTSRTGRRSIRWRSTRRSCTPRRCCTRRCCTRRCRNPTAAGCTGLIELPTAHPAAWCPVDADVRTGRWAAMAPSHRLGTGRRRRGPPRPAATVRCHAAGSAAGHSAAGGQRPDHRPPAAQHV